MIVLPVTITRKCFYTLKWMWVRYSTVLSSFIIIRPIIFRLINWSYRRSLAVTCACYIRQVGDGTTSVVVLASELLREAEKLVSMRLHPQTIIAGYRRATDVAREALTNVAQDNSADPAKFREDLLKVCLIQIKVYVCYVASCLVCVCLSKGQLNSRCLQ